MEPKIYILTTKVVMEIKTADSYEYYFRDKDDITDYFKFEFGTLTPMTREELNNIVMVCSL